MRRRTTDPGIDESGMIPFADLLSNTVGIILFVLAFTIIQSGGVLVPKRLPRERREDERSPLYFLCHENRVIPLDDDLTDKLFEGLPEPTYDTADSFIRKFNAQRAEDEYFVVIPHGDTNYNSTSWYYSEVSFEITAEFQPKPGAGFTIQEIQSGKSGFEELLKQVDTAEEFVYFLVSPDEIETFRFARDLVENQYGVNSGWNPKLRGENVKFDLSGSGGVEATWQ